LGVSLESYILGVGDVIGELRREVLECLRLGMVERAEEDLKLMERIYLDLLSLEEASLLLKGLRRKLDVARGVIEATRGEVTSELARARLSASIQRLVEKLEKLDIR
jgi:translin